MRNHLLSERTTIEIDTIVERLLADLGHPEPPLSLDIVRDRLALDRSYYSATDHSVLRETAHCLIVAGKQVIKRPMLLLEAVRKCELKALFLPDQKRILIDSTLPELKQRWAEGHEVAHDLIPWHRNLTHGDPLHSLSQNCHVKIEAEANFAAGRLLFLRDRYSKELLASPVTFERVKSLSAAFGNTITSGLWRCVETLETPTVGMVSAHPWAAAAGHPSSPVRYFIRNHHFEKQFANITEGTLFRLLAGVVHRRGGGLIGAKEITLQDSAGDNHVFMFECFSNTHETLTLGQYRGEQRAVVVVPCRKEAPHAA